MASVMRMAKRFPNAPSILRAAIEAGCLPYSAEVKRNGQALWVSDELHYTVWIEKVPDGQMRWSLNVGDAKFGHALEKYGRMAVRLRGVQRVTPWPAEIDESFTSFLELQIGAAAHFVHDRADLCELFASPEDVRRGEVYAWLPLANYPARLVQALVLAGDMQRRDLETAIRRKLAVGSVEFPDGDTLDVGESATRWAKTFSRALELDIRL